MVYKSLNNLVPKYTSDMFIFKLLVTNQVTRSSMGNDLWIPRIKLTVRQKTLTHSGTTLYNRLPLEIRRSSSASSFETRLYRYFLGFN